MMTDDRQPRTQWCGETMTAPMTSREELLVAGLEQLLAAVHADDPKREILVRIGDAIREAKALTDPAKGPRTPLDLSPNELNTLATDAFREAAQGAVNPAAQFVMWCLMEGCWQGDDVDGGAAQDKAEALGLIVQTQYDPAKHGENPYCEPGDTWYVPSPELLAALGDTSTPSTGLPAPAPHAEVREALGEQQIDILAKRVAGAELNYRNSYEKNGGDHIETGRNWDLMRRSGDAIRQHFYEREEAPQQDRGGK